MTDAFLTHILKGLSSQFGFDFHSNSSFSLIPHPYSGSSRNQLNMIIIYNFLPFKPPWTVPLPHPLLRHHSIALPLQLLHCDLDYHCYSLIALRLASASASFAAIAPSAEDPLSVTASSSAPAVALYTVVAAGEPSVHLPVDVCE